MSNKKLNKSISKMSMNTIGKALKKLNLPIVSNCDNSKHNADIMNNGYCAKCSSDEWK